MYLKAKNEANELLMQNDKAGFINKLLDIEVSIVLNSQNKMKIKTTVLKKENVVAESFKTKFIELNAIKLNILS